MLTFIFLFSGQKSFIFMVELLWNSHSIYKIKFITRIFQVFAIPNIVVISVDYAFIFLLFMVGLLWNLHYVC